MSLRSLFHFRFIHAYVPPECLCATERLWFYKYLFCVCYHSQIVRKTKIMDLATNYVSRPLTRLFISQILNRGKQQIVFNKTLKITYLNKTTGAHKTPLPMTNPKYHLLKINTYCIALGCPRGHPTGAILCVITPKSRDTNCPSCRLLRHPTPGRPTAISSFLSSSVSKYCLEPLPCTLYLKAKLLVLHLSERQDIRSGCVLGEKV